MSSEGSLARLPGARVTLLDQAELATEISFSLMTKRRQPIKVTPNGSAAVGLLARRFRRSQPEAYALAEALSFGPSIMSPAATA